jgi:DNA primase
VFNYDRQQQAAKFCLVVEGAMDAIAVDGLAILSNECNESQALIVDSLNREVIVVPDRDKAGMELVKAAMEYGWNVAFPDWDKDIKDCADANQRYGQLFTMRSILESVETSNLKIQLRTKKWF